MPEYSPEEIAEAQLAYDVAEAKQALDRSLHGTGSGEGVVDHIESLIGKVVMRWWFARIVRNKKSASKETASALEERRKQRAMTMIACCQIINAKSTQGKPPDNLQLQLAHMDLTAGQAAIWQALIDAAIIAPDVKQDYLDGAVASLYQRVVDFSQRIDLSAAPGATQTQ